MSDDGPIRSLTPSVRHGIIGGRHLLELIQTVLENRISAWIVDQMDVRGILECLLEEYFYGGTFRDEFFAVLTELRLPTDVIEQSRTAIIHSIASQVHMVFGGIRPSCQYTYQLDGNGDIIITELAPRPTLGKMKMRLVG